MLSVAERELLETGTSEEAHSGGTGRKSRLELMKPSSHHHPQQAISNVFELLIVLRLIVLRIFKLPLDRFEQTQMGKYLFEQDRIFDRRKWWERKCRDLLQGEEGCPFEGVLSEALGREGRW